MISALGTFDLFRSPHPTPKPAPSGHQLCLGTEGRFSPASVAAYPGLPKLAARGTRPCGQDWPERFSSSLLEEKRPEEEEDRIYMLWGRAEQLRSPSAGPAGMWATRTRPSRCRETGKGPAPQLKHGEAGKGKVCSVWLLPQLHGPCGGGDLKRLKEGRS